MTQSDTTNEFDGPLRLNGDLDLSRLRERLASVHYDQSTIIEMIRSSGSKSDGMDVTIAMRRSAEHTPFNALFRLFALGQSVTFERAQNALEETMLQQAIGAGLLQVIDQQVTATAKLLPFQSRWVFGDFQPNESKRSIQADHVLGSGAASATLSALTPRGQVASVLDLGCGSGVQSFVSCQHAKRVVATDVNHRALNFAAFGAALNGFHNIQFRCGSMFEPVKGETFDLIVSNPPFVISPESRFVFRDGGLNGDHFSERLIRELPDYLNENGRAVVLFNWHHQDEDDWTNRPEQWLSTDTCDAWLLRFHSEDPLVYAAQWLRPTEHERYDDLLNQWVDYYQQIGAARVSAGALILRKRSGKNHWLRYDTLPEGKRVGDCGDQIDRIMDSEDLLCSIERDDCLLDLSLRLSSDHRMEQVLSVEDDRWVVRSRSLRQTKGLTFSGEVDPFIADLLAGCNGRRPLRELVDELIDRVDIPKEDVVTTCLTIVKKLMRSGLLYYESK